jgi:NOL1/NOP2/fmu family ribosome biogenesis protein
MTQAWRTAGVSIHTMSIPWDSSWPVFVPEPERSAVLGYFTARFGVPLTVFTRYALLEHGKAYMLVPDSPHLARLATLKVHSIGLPVLRKMPRYLKPTTAALQRFGQQATRHTLELSVAQVAQLLREYAFPLQMDWQPGYVILCHAGHVLGCGLYTPGRLRSQIPRRQSVHPHFDDL